MNQAHIATMWTTDDESPSVFYATIVSVRRLMPNGSYLNMLRPVTLDENNERKGAAGLEFLCVYFNELPGKKTKEGKQIYILKETSHKYIEHKVVICPVHMSVVPNLREAGKPVYTLDEKNIVFVEESVEFFTQKKSHTREKLNNKTHHKKKHTTPVEPLTQSSQKISMNDTNMELARTSKAGRPHKPNNKYINE